MSAKDDFLQLVVSLLICFGTLVLLGVAASQAKLPVDERIIINKELGEVIILVVWIINVLGIVRALIYLRRLLLRLEEKLR
jgi:hypothetical protein